MFCKKFFSVYVQCRNLSNKVGIIGVPFCKGQPIQGTDLAPELLRQSDLIQHFKEFCKHLRNIYFYTIVFISSSPVQVDKLIILTINKLIFVFSFIYADILWLVHIQELKMIF